MYLTVKKFWKSVKIWLSYCHRWWLLFWRTVRPTRVTKIPKKEEKTQRTRTVANWVFAHTTNVVASRYSFARWVFFGWWFLVSGTIKIGLTVVEMWWVKIWVIALVWPMAYTALYYPCMAGFKGGGRGPGPRPPTNRGPPTKPFIILLLTGLAFLIFRLLQSPT